MKTLITLTILSALITAYAFAADASGHWTGTGSLQMTGMADAACDRVTLDLTDSGTGLLIREYSFDCQGMHQEISPMTLDLRGGSYYAGNQKVGERRGDTVTLVILDPQTRATITSVFEPAGGSLQLHYDLQANGFEEKLNATLHK